MHKHLITTISALALLAGCASSPKDIIETGTVHTGTLKGTPQQAAACVARSAEFSGYLANVLNHTDSLEIIVRATPDPAITVAVWRITAAAGGSSHTTHVWRDMLINHQGLVEKLKGNC